MKLYMRVTKDEYSIPLAVATSVAELSRILGISSSTINNMMRYERNHKVKYPSYVVVEIEDDV